MKFKKLLAIGICAVVVGTQAAAPVSVQASTADEIAMVQQAQAAANAELAALQNAISGMETQKAAILEKIDGYDKELVTTMTAINALDGQIELTENALDQTGKDLAAAEADAQTQYEAMKERIQYLYEQGGTDGWMNVMFGDATLSQGVDKVDFTTSLYDYDRAELENYEKTIQQVDALKAQQVEQKSQLQTMRLEQVDAKENLESLKAVAEVASDNYEEQITAAEEVANEYYAVIAEQNAVIVELQARQEREIAEAAAYEAAMAAQAAMAQQAAEEAAYAEAVAAEEAGSGEYAEDTYTDAGSTDASYTEDNGGDASYTEDNYSGYTEDNGGDASYTEDTGNTDSYSENTDSDNTYSDNGTTSDDNTYSDDSGNTAVTDASDSGYVGGQAEQYAAQQAAFANGAEQVDTSGGAGTNATEVSATGQAIADYATQFVGNPYVWGGTSLTNGADCSGFVQSVYNNFGIGLSRTTYTQANEGVAVSYEDMQPGDVINYGFHTAIYIGNNQIVHAASDDLGIIVQNNPAYQPIVTIRRFV
ncbi:MAG: NlpC/P60 family protein [Eubacteriales bacterium]|nr:NlpC/P60 family protein [Eubacteriales bacterium]